MSVAYNKQINYTKICAAESLFLSPAPKFIVVYFLLPEHTQKPMGDLILYTHIPGGGGGLDMPIGGFGLHMSAKIALYILFKNSIMRADGGLIYGYCVTTVTG